MSGKGKSRMGAKAAVKKTSESESAPHVVPPAQGSPMNDSVGSKSLKSRKSGGGSSSSVKSSPGSVKDKDGDERSAASPGTTSSVRSGGASKGKAGGAGARSGTPTQKKEGGGGEGSSVGRAASPNDSVKSGKTSARSGSRKSGARSSAPTRGGSASGKNGSRARCVSPADSMGSSIGTHDDLANEFSEFGFEDDGKKKPATPQAETPEERAARLLREEEEEKEERRREFIRINYTILHYTNLDGTKRSRQMDRLTTYMDVQTEVARVTGKPAHRMFNIIHPETKERISSHNFVEGPEWNVVETFRAKIPKFYPQLPTKWDFTKYHAAPPDWVDPVIAKRLADEAKKRREEDEERKEAEAEEIDKAAKAARVAAEAQANEEWADLLGDI